MVVMVSPALHKTSSGSTHKGKEIHSAAAARTGAAAPACAPTLTLTPALPSFCLQEGGEPALLPVHADAGAGAARNPPAPESSADDFEHITHRDAAAAAATPAPAATGSKNGVQLRPVGNLPLKIPSAMRKRAYDETAMVCGLAGLRLAGWACLWVCAQSGWGLLMWQGQ
jgi:hypothetical protein